MQNHIASANMSLSEGRLTCDVLPMLKTVLGSVYWTNLVVL